MRLRFAAFVAGMMLLVGGSFAHGDKKHVLGTVEKISAGSVTVKARDGKSVEVKLSSATVYIAHSGATDTPARFSDMSVGDLVVIHASPKGEELEADEVKFSAPKKP